MPARQVVRSGPGRPLLWSADALDLTQVGIRLPDGGGSTAAEIVDRTFTDALVIGHAGVVVAEQYSTPGGESAVHPLMSITKSVVGCVAMRLIGAGLIDPDRRVESYVPDLAGSGFRGATVRQLLDMSSGVRFNEDYDDPASDVRRLGEWVMGGHRSQGRGVYEFLTTLDAEAAHGSRFRYRSSESDALGWVCERAARRPMAELISSLVWRPIGAEQDATLVCDTNGVAVHDGGLEATARDLFRFGQMLLDHGTAPESDGGSQQVVPPAWLRRTWAVESQARRLFLQSPAEEMFRGGWYRNQFWVRPSPSGAVLLGLGIFGQLLYVCRRARTVAVKLSSWPTAQNPLFLQETLRALDDLSALLSRRPSPPREVKSALTLGVS